MQTEQLLRRSLERPLPQPQDQLATQPDPHGRSHVDLLPDKQVPLPHEADPNRAGEDVAQDPSEVQRGPWGGQVPLLSPRTVDLRAQAELHPRQNEHGSQQPLVLLRIRRHQDHLAEAETEHRPIRRLRGYLCHNKDVIRMVNKYVNTIQTMFYFNALKIQRSIHEIIRHSRSFVAFFNKYQKGYAGLRMNISMARRSRSMRTLMMCSARMLWIFIRCSRSCPRPAIPHISSISRRGSRAASARRTNICTTDHPSFMLHASSFIFPYAHSYINTSN